jgi:hypothetical protein
MTSYQARLKEIRELKAKLNEQITINMAIGAYMEAKEGPPPRTQPPPLRTPEGIFPLIEPEETKIFPELRPHITETEQEQLIFPKARKWLIVFAIIGMVSLLVGYWLDNPDASLIGLIFIICVVAAGTVFLVFDKEIIEKTQ